MIHIYIEGHPHQHDLYELAKAFFPKKQIFIKEERGGFTPGHLIESIYDSEGQMATSRSKVNGKPIENTKAMVDYPLISKLKSPEYKLIKASFYQVLCELSGNSLPWGILTGVRPAKLTHELEAHADTAEALIDLFTNFFRLDLDKAELLIEISKFQKELLLDLEENSYSVFINIPFCETKCSYCSLTTAPLARYEDSIEGYIDLLVEEIIHTKELIGDRPLSTVYIGGGTPSSIGGKNLERVLLALEENLGRARELCVECGRPENIDKDLIKTLKRYGVNRISINPQTMKDETLKRIGRNHSAQDIFKAYEIARAEGMKTINMDLIVGLPREGLEDFKLTLEKVKDLNPENLTIHTLSVKKNSKLKKQKNQAYENPETINTILKEAEKYAKEQGYRPYYLYRQKQTLGNYENIGYAREGTACLYNIISMEEIHDVVGIGMGAVSKFLGENKIQRQPNFKSIEEYISRFPVQLDRKEQTLERMKKS